MSCGVYVVQFSGREAGCMCERGSCLFRVLLLLLLLYCDPVSVTVTAAVAAAAGVAFIVRHAVGTIDEGQTVDASALLTHDSGAGFQLDFSLTRNTITCVSGFGFSVLVFVPLLAYVTVAVFSSVAAS